MTSTSQWQLGYSQYHLAVAGGSMIRYGPTRYREVVLLYPSQINKL